MRLIASELGLNLGLNLPLDASELGLNLNLSLDLRPRSV